MAIISTGIGALILAVGALTAAFTASEEGQNKFRKILGVIGSVTGNLVDLLSDLGEGIISVFENPKEALLNFKDLLVENITNRFNSILETVGYVGKAIKLVFQGEFSQALDVGKKAASSLVDSFTGIPDTIDKASESVKGFAKEIADDASAAAKIADQRAEADKRTRDLIVERAKADRDRAELLEKAVNKEKFSTQERIQFLIEAGELEDSITQKEIEAARLRFEAKQAENALSKSTKEDLEEEANLKAELIRLETAKLTKQKEVTSQIIGLKNEEAAAEKAKQDEQDRLDKEAETKEQARLDSIQKIRDDFKLKQEEKEAQTNLQKAELEEQRKLAELDKLNATEEEKQAISDYYAQAKLEAEAKDAEASKLITQKEQEAKITALQGYASAVSALSGFLGKETGAGKALAVAASLINTYAAIAGQLKAFAGVPVPGYAIAQAIATGASGFAAVRDILKVKVPAGSVATPSISGSSSGGGGASITAAAQAPQFNVIGGGAQNQLAGLLADQTQKPVKAYVVSNEVTTAQSLDRNIVESATLG